jgi:GNAT superfamily N-acetyltransferase
LEHSRVRLYRYEDTEALVHLALRAGMDWSPDEIRSHLIREMQSELRNELRHFRRLVVENEDCKIIGTGCARDSVFGPCDWPSTTIQVDVAHRSKGVGSRILAGLEEHMKMQGAAGLEGRVSVANLDAHRWALNRGFSTFVEEMRCELALSRSLPWGAATCELEGVSCRPLTDLDSIDGFKILVAITTTLLVEAGLLSDRADHVSRMVGSFLRTRASVAPDLTWIAAEGERWIGVTTNTRRGNDVHTWFTGVDRSRRGRGVGQLLKVSAIESARSAGVVRMTSDVALSNSPMLALNRRLGYSVTHSIQLLRKPFDLVSGSGHPDTVPSSTTGRSAH